MNFSALRLVKVATEFLVTLFAIWYVLQSPAAGFFVALIPLVLGLLNVYPRLADSVMAISLVLAAALAVVPASIKRPAYESASEFVKELVPPSAGAGTSPRPAQAPTNGS